MPSKLAPAAAALAKAARSVTFGASRSERHIPALVLAERRSVLQRLSRSYLPDYNIGALVNLSTRVSVILRRLCILQLISGTFPSWNDDTEQL